MAILGWSFHVAKRLLVLVYRFRPSDSVHRHLLPHPNGWIAEQAEAVLFLQEEGRNYMARMEQRKAMKGKKGKKGSLDRNPSVGEQDAIGDDKSCR